MEEYQTRPTPNRNEVFPGEKANLAAELARSAEVYRKSSEWTQPLEFDLGSKYDIEAVECLVAESPDIQVSDNVNEIAESLFEYENPSAAGDGQARQEYVQGIKEQGLGFGKWFYFPWSNELVRYPEKDVHRALRTSRNRSLISSEEQDKLYDSTIAVFGLSVGSNVVDKLLFSGIGGKLIIADMDTLEPSNLNRIDADMTDVGSAKIDLMAKKISKTDPYIDQVHLRNGISAEELSEVIQNHNPDIMIDEVDDLRMKAEIRSQAKTAEIPVIMATDVGDKSVIDIERYDAESAEAFHGRLKNSDLEKLLSDEPLSAKERGAFMLKIVGARNLNTRIVDSLSRQGKDLAGLPQLGTTAAIGGSLATVAAREILLERGMKTGRFSSSPKKILDMASHSTKRQAFETFRGFIRSNRG